MNLSPNLKKIRCEKPLIHCITNHISINDCANAVLALGGKPIMAEHPKEVSEITKTAKSLAVNPGNISDSRMEAIMTSGKTAKEEGIPIVIDAVGVACSKLRLEFVRKFINEFFPSVVKGNEAEIRALCGVDFSTKGIDSQNESTVSDLANLSNQASQLFNSTVLISGKVDAVSDGKKTALIRNGSYLLPFITGTGCMLNVVCGTYLSVNNPFDSAFFSALTMGIAGEWAEENFRKNNSITAFRNSVFDALFLMDDEHIIKNAKVDFYE